MPENIISVDPDICNGKPTIAGTRIMITNILGMIAGGYDIDKILEEYPELTKEEVISALDYASRVVDEDRVFRRA